MAINENVYGAKNQWFDAYFQQAEITDKNKIAYFGENAKTLGSGVANNKLSYAQPINKSLSYCGLGAESALSHVAFFGFAAGERKLLEYNDRQVTNFAFFEKTTDTNYTSQTFLNINELDYNMWVENMNFEFNNTRDLSPLTVVNPHNIILFIEVEGKTELFHGWTTVSLAYLPTAIQQYNWRYFRRAKVTAYYGSKIDNVEYSPIAGHATGHANYKAFQISILDKYDCTEKNTSFYMYGGSINSDNTIWGFPSINEISANTDLINLAYITENGKEHLKIESNNEGYIEYYPEMIEDIKKTAACFGLYFTGRETAAINGDLTNSDMYIGLLDNDGVGRGRYLQGTETVNAPQAQSGFKDMHDIPYDYKAVDNTKYSNGTIFNLNVETSAFNKFYALTKTQVQALANELYSIANDVPSGVSVTEYNMKTFLTNNPIDCIISLKKFPVKNIPLIGTPNNIYLGAKQTDIVGCEVLAKTFVYYFDFSSSNDTSLYPVNGDTFLDYEPYTKVTIVIPFCGSVEIPCTYLYKYGGVRVALMIDFVSGACTAFIMVNDNVINSVQGNCAIDLPVSGLQAATLDSNINNTVQNYNATAISSAATIVAGGLTFLVGAATFNPMAMIGGAGAIVGGAIKAETAEKKTNYELQHMQAPYKCIGSASGAIAQCGDLRCKMLISRPVMSDNYNAEIYSKTIGFACLINSKVSDFTGLTQGDIRIDKVINSSGMSPTDTEKQMIYNAFATGVIL